MTHDSSKDHSHPDEIDKPSFVIEEVQLFALWELKATHNLDDVCAICLSPFSEMCTDCQAKVSMKDLYMRRASNVEVIRATWQPDAQYEHERWGVDDHLLTEEKRAQCPINCGKCNHKFHAHCLSQWLRTRPTCPLDKTRWELKCTM
ncbi:Zinc finger RING-H2-type [Perkinsela sp. CCAP 1560/4]|nr:Zinc finger RING-H2-type [Perkinsela sp. CCAP 1560/4]KNH07924.1 Zinc finger RING-H2-type [Perkinsela sp. CCAP 1560/4]|eukprot:KNH05418.1 Zinc finger RING-H2-type [Perkinsela sp. CCAP 1560/4]